ncbi:MAG: terminase family protein, partial [Oscillospiraceae bacterium]|nr:terminase family protein [Oscillospiraceae bacterium]
LILDRLTRHPQTGDRMLLGRTLQTLERNVLEPMRRRYGTRVVSQSDSKGVVRIGGRPFYTAGAGRRDDAEKLQGLGLVYAYGDEITTWHPDVFQMLKSRLSCAGARFDGTCNPEHPAHWLKAGLLDRPDLDVKQWHFTIDDNPFLPPDYVANLKREYAGVFYERYILGRWVLAEGRVYPMVSERPEEFILRGPADAFGTPRGPACRWYISVDYGTVNPCSMGLWCVFKAGGAGPQAVRVRELYHDSRRAGGQKTDEEYYGDLKALAGGLPIRRVVVDPSASSFIQVIRRHREFPVWKADNSVADGIRVTAGLLGAGRLRFHESCRDTLREFSLYRWDDGKSADAPLKENDHAMDDIRYFCNTIMTRETL